MADYQGRQVAYKVQISDLNKGSYVKEEGWQPNYVITKRGLKVSRANIIATVVSIETGTPYNNLVLDDGTGTISLRPFGEITNLNHVEIGDIVNVIGKPREFNGEKYILPEIIQKVKNDSWVKLRQKEFSMSPPSVEASTKLGSDTPIATESIEEEVVEKQVPPENPFQKIYRLIKELDPGDGADTNELIKASGLHNAEELVKELLKEGEIFEIRRGRLKILE